MIRYDLICRDNHEFEGWFSNSSDYDEQRKRRLVQCPSCGSAKVEKAIMAPNVSTSRRKSAIISQQKDALATMQKAAQTIRKEIEDKCEYVGDKFANEARAIYYGEKEERAIYGEASVKDAKDLFEEGVSIAPLPEILSPKRSKKIN